MKPSLDLLDVLAILDRGHDRGVGRRTPDTFFFERLYEGRFGVTRRRFGEVLFRSDRVELEGLALLHERQTAFFVVVFAFRPGSRANAEEAARIPLKDD